MKREISPAESIEIIGQMLRTSRQRIANQAPVYLVWGVLVLASSLTHFVLLMFTGVKHPYLIWPVLMTIGGILTPVLLKKYEQGCNNVFRPHDELYLHR